MVIDDTNELFNRVLWLYARN